ncbi:MAG: M48 family metalloprotease [Deltaproteobacteria bacterium]|nr:M48 family metalloprotease [Deltaproteobacteria bacterium]
MVVASRVYRRVVLSFINSFFVLVFVAVLFIVVTTLLSRFGGARAAMFLVTILGGTAFLMFLLSELCVVALTRARIADPKEHRRFTDSMEQLCGARGFQVPRLYVFDNDTPNAAAFGPGLPYMAAVGVTTSILKLLDDEELKGVLAHEMAHVRCRDIGLMTVLALLTDGASQLSRQLLKQGGAIQGTAAGAALQAFVWLLNNVLLKLARGALMQEREYAADALGALYCGTSRPLSSALSKLGKSHAPRETSVLDSLFISHPQMKDRIDALASYSQR